MRAESYICALPLMYLMWYIHSVETYCKPCYVKDSLADCRRVIAPCIALQSSKTPDAVLLYSCDVTVRGVSGTSRPLKVLDRFGESCSSTQSTRLSRLSVPPHRAPTTTAPTTAATTAATRRDIIVIGSTQSTRLPVPVSVPPHRPPTTTAPTTAATSRDIIVIGVCGGVVVVIGGVVVLIILRRRSTNYPHVVRMQDIRRSYPTPPSTVTTPLSRTSSCPLLSSACSKDQESPVEPIARRTRSRLQF